MPKSNKPEWIRGEKALELAKKGKKLYRKDADGVWREADPSIMMYNLPAYALSQYGVKA